MKHGKLLRKSLCIALAAVTIGGFAAAVPVFTGDGIVAEAASTLSYGDYSYKIVENDYAVITKYAGKDKDVVIPESIHDFKVISIGSGAFTGNELMESVVIPEGVVTIGSGAFANCVNLSDVTLPETVQVLDYKAFYDCPVLSEIKIPSSVRILGSSVFNNCASLREVEFDEDIDLVEIPKYAFNNCYSLERIDIPASVEKIGFQAFGSCTSLEEIVFHGMVSSIGERAFYNCISLSDVELEEGLISIGLQAFYRCSNLKEITIPQSVQKIGLMAFGYTYNGAVKKFVPHPDFKMNVYKDSAGLAYAVKNGFQFEVVLEELMNTSDWDSLDFVLGQPVVFKGSAEGGSGEYTYSYYYKRVANDSWKVIKENTTETEAQFVPTAETLYDVRIVVTDSMGNQSEVISIAAPIGKNTIVNTSFLASSKVKLGKNVKINAYSVWKYEYGLGEQPGSDTYSYYFRRSGNTAWKTIGQEDTANRNASFKPTSAGKYEVKVVAKYGDVSDEKIMTVTVVE